QRIATVEGLRANCLLPDGDDVLVGTSEAHLLRLSDGSLQPVEPFERTPGRESWHTPWGGPPDVRTLSRGVDGTLYANVHVGGVARSEDGGDTWTDTMDIHADVHQVLAHPTEPGLVVAAAAIGLGISTDSAQSWRFEAEGLHGTYLRAVTIAAQTVVVSASSGSGGRQACVYRRALDGNGEFHRCRDGLPEWFSDNVDSACLDASGSSVVLGAPDGTIYVSADEGESWAETARGLPPVRCVSFA
ncbi:MAG: hypothetical protein ACE5KX_07955, partial [Acidimicrobiia bacterium]